MFRSWFNRINYTITTVSNGTNARNGHVQRYILPRNDQFFHACNVAVLVSELLFVELLYSLSFFPRQLITQYRIIDSQRTVRFNVRRFSLFPFFNCSISRDLSISLENRAFVTYASSTNIDAKRKNKKNGIETAQVGNYILFQEKSSRKKNSIKNTCTRY